MESRYEMRLPMVESWASGDASAMQRPKSSVQAENQSDIATEQVSPEKEGPTSTSVVRAKRAAVAKRGEAGDE
eukprot:scaffold104956_cov28-Tisochrysis_lutea.AAC.10